MASKKKAKKKAAEGPRCPRCSARAELFWHGRRELCQACIDALRTPLETDPITFGSLVRGVVGLAKRVGISAVLITVAFQLPLVALTLWSEVGPAVGTVWVFVALLGNGMVIDLALQHVTDERTSVTAALRTAGRAYIGLLFAAFVSSLVVGVFMLLLVVPGILRALSYAIVLPLIIDGDASSTDALTLSKERMKGHRWPAFLAFAAVYVAPAAWFALNVDIALAGLAPDSSVPPELTARTAIFGLVDALLAVPVTLLGVVLHLKLRKPAKSA